MTVLDASALLAYAQGEPGEAVVEGALDAGTAVCSAANWSEVIQQLRARGSRWDLARALFMSFGLTVEPVTIQDAERAAELWEPRSGLSLGDRLCLALGERRGEEVLTADQAWAGRPGVMIIR
ncbi:MAG: type II toxin-antitoxin system VapC family toxin [Actinobacteria bacterium]|nr:type II toxin-antitoxin system VapC family toxin [Actinomycetota bacterium]